jgi:type VI secretion system protein ImpK
MNPSDRAAVDVAATDADADKVTEANAEAISTNTPRPSDELRRTETWAIAPSCGDNPLLAAANRLVNLVPQIRLVSTLDHPAALQRQLIEEIRAFERAALAANVPQEEVVGARYCLCTVLDETAAQTPWGTRGVWARHSLLVTFHNETWGGEKYYQLLARLAQNPERHRNLIELVYFCNALGFEGKFRIVDNGYSQLEVLKRRIATMLGNVRGGYEARLSPHWQGVAAREAAWRLIPPWVVASLCALLAALLFLWFMFALGPRSDEVYARLAALELPKLVVPDAYAAPPPARLRVFLEPEIRAGLVEVQDLADRSVVTLRGDGLFDSGSVTVKSRYEAVLGRVAAALDEVRGAVVVTGYTDNVPMRSARFPSNWHLSTARAESVGLLLSRYLAERGRVTAVGRGEADPIASNGSGEGRAMNRRVEITLALSSADIHRQLNAAPSGRNAPRPEPIR